MQEYVYILVAQVRPKSAKKSKVTNLFQRQVVAPSEHAARCIVLHRILDQGLLCNCFTTVKKVRRVREDSDNLDKGD